MLAVHVEDAHLCITKSVSNVNKMGPEPKNNERQQAAMTTFFVVASNITYMRGRATRALTMPLYLQSESSGRPSEAADAGNDSESAIKHNKVGK